MPEVDTENVREAVCSSKWMTLGCRLKTQDYARVEAAAKAAGLRNPSVWLKNVVLRALTGRPGNPKAAAAGAALSVEEAWETQRQQMACPSCGVVPGCDCGRNAVVMVPRQYAMTQTMPPELMAALGKGIIKAIEAMPQVEPGRDVTLAEPRSWSEEWDKFMQMDPQEATERFTELQACRELPPGFKAWTKDRKIAWLDAHWPLEGK